MNRLLVNRFLSVYSYLIQKINNHIHYLYFFHKFQDTFKTALFSLA
nr:MAG TPA: hypothetical protein [Caudoviricetes sp.]